ncbi:unnamed protein product [Ceutorhynchus assimilis]|uniref:Uncharacterized protein n=1 Tax=Ceutorhynchus assimilis TaxID=467358 RepID=A0A9N9MPL4_9CUCU|nr:unnamed protein product [Ceutorhynchus assimilis]
MNLDFTIICRICMGHGNMMSLFKVGMHKKMMGIAAIQVWPNDGLPGQICGKCASRLHIAFQLKRQCERSDIRLRQHKILLSQEEDKKILEEAPSIIEPNINMVEGSLPQENQIESRVFVQPNNVIDSLRPSTYDHFMTVTQNNQAITQVTYANITCDGQIQVPAYNLQGMIYNTQYTLQNTQIDTPADIHQQHSRMLPLEINTPPPIQSEPVTQTENSENVKTKQEAKNSHNQEGKACTTCGKIFRTNIKLNRHMKIHTYPKDLPHKCHICGKGFSHGGNFKIHLRIHNDERPFKCPICNKGCRQAQDLEKHMRTHTGERPHKCNFCPKAFATSSNLTAHIRTHTGERPYVCNVCQKAFCQSNELTKHTRMHTGEKSHICDICNKGFNGSSGLVSHRRKHTGERPYVCPKCNLGFISSWSLSSHVKMHNKMHTSKCAQCELSFTTLTTLKEHFSSAHGIVEMIQCKCCAVNFSTVQDYFEHTREKVGDD